MVTVVLLAVFHVVASLGKDGCAARMAAPVFAEDAVVETGTSGVLFASSVWVLLCGKAHLGPGLCAVSGRGEGRTLTPPALPGDKAHSSPSQDSGFSSQDVCSQLLGISFTTGLGPG